MSNLSLPSPLHVLSTLIALFAFAGNSVLCRLALQGQSIDATSFTILRLLSGAITLLLIVRISNLYRDNLAKRKITSQRLERDPALASARATWLSAFMLFAYAASFSYAYIMLDAGLGALILFGCVQLSMITVSIIQKQPLTWIKYFGIASAFMGLVYLVNAQSTLSDVSFSLFGFGLMVVSGVAWAGYTLLGKGSSVPLLDTSANFSKSLVFAVPLCSVYLLFDFELSPTGIWLSIASGAITSGLGYAIWYYALNGLNAVQAGVVQLLVPVIAAFGGLLWIGEAITLELIIAQAVILGGIALVMFTPSKIK